HRFLTGGATPRPGGIIVQADSNAPTAVNGRDAAGKPRIGNGGKALGLDAAREVFRFRKAPDAFDQIGVSRLVARDHAAKTWDRLEGIEIVKPVETGHHHLGKFEAIKA